MPQLSRAVASAPCAGDKLGIALVESATAASEVLAWRSQHRHSSKPVRIWDLQRLQAYEKLQQQKQAQASFAPGEKKSLRLSSSI